MAARPNLARLDIEQAFRESEARFQALFDGLGAGIIFCDLNHVVLMVNREMERLTGFTQNEMVGKSVFGLFIDDAERTNYLAKTARRLEGASERYEIRHRRKDGSSFWAQVNATPFRDSSGEIMGSLGVVSDITEQKHIAEEVSHQRELLRWVVDTNPNFIFVKDHRGHFVLVNKAFAEFYGRTPEEMVGLMNIDVHPHKDEVPQFLREDQQVMRTGEPLLVPERAFRHPRTGRVVWGQTIKVPIELPSAQGRYVLGVVTDISSRKHAEEESRKLQKQLVHSQKMEAIGQLAAGVAHDLNNALAAVVGHLHLMETTPKLDVPLKASVHVALQGCERAGSLIQQLLSFSKPRKLDFKKISLQSILTQTIDFVGKVIGKDVRLVIEGQAQTLLVMADEAQIQQALMNMIINATHAMPRGGTITFRFKTEEVLVPELFNPGARAGSFAVLSVTDTGSGIKPEHLDKIFEPFFSTKGEGKGTGLGLSMVYGIMQQHHGWVDVESRLGLGTTFSLFFPRVDGELAEATQTPALRQTPIDRGMVMIIDDEPVLVDLAKTFLSRSGVHSIGFSDPEEALAWYTQHFAEIHLVLMDMKMPKMDGENLFRALKSANLAVKVVLLSGYSHDGTTSALLAEGAIKFFQKPLRYPDLVKFIGDELLSNIPSQVTR